MNKPAEKLSERDKQPHKAVRNRYTFDSAIYPKHWQSLSDEALINQYRTNHDQLIVCYLLHRYKTPVVAISFSYLKNEEAVIDFTHDLYIKLVELLKHCDIQRFPSFLVTIVKNKHKDDLSKFRTVKNYEHHTDHPSALSIPYLWVILLLKSYFISWQQKNIGFT